jgi:hypothetical protein
MNYFSLASRHRRILLSILVIFVLAGILIPNPQYAKAWPWDNAATAIRNLYDAVVNQIVPILIEASNPALLFLKLYIYFQILFFKILSWVFFGWAVIFAAIFKIMLEVFIQGDGFAITRNAVFLNAWNQVKVYANMLIVLQLIAAAVMMMLNLKMWGDPKKIAISVIGVALLINFSVVIVGVMIDASNILIKSLVVNGGAELGIIKQINDAWNTTVARLPHPLTIPSASVYMLMQIFFCGIYAIVAFAFFYFVLIFIQRYIMLAFLFIISPMAFALWSFPKTSHLFTSWWHHFLKNCFIGLEAAFVLKLSVEILSSGVGIQGAANPFAPGNFSYTSLFNGQMLFSMIQILFLVVIVMGFLIVGLKMAAKTAGPIADAMMAVAAVITVAVVEAVVTGGASLAATGEGLAMQGAQLATKGAGKAAGALTGSDAFEKQISGSKVLQDNIKGSLSSGVAKIGEAVGVMPAGSAQVSETKERERKVDQWRGSFAGQSDVQALTDELKSTRNEYKQAAITERLGQLGAIDAIGTPVEQRAALKNAIKNGVATKILSQSADNGDLDENRIKEEKRSIESTLVLGTTKDRKGNIVTAANKEAYLKEESELRAKHYYHARRDNSDVKNLDPDTLLKVAEEETSRGAAALEEAINKGIISKVKGGSAVATAGLIKKAKDKLGIDLSKTAEKEDYRLREWNQKAIDDYIDTNLGGVKNLANTLTAQKAVRREQLEQNLPSMSAKERIENIDIGDIDEDLIVSGNLTPAMIRNFRSATPTKKTHITGILGSKTPPPGTGLYKLAHDATTRGDTAEFGRLNRIIYEMEKI